MKKEHIVLVGRFIAILAIAPALAWMLARSYQEGTIIRKTTHSLADIVAFGGGEPIEMFPSLMLGLYFGLLGLFVIDARKRYQGALQVIGTVVGLLTLALFGRLLSNIDFLDPYNWIMFFLGLIFGIIVEIDKIKNIINQILEPKPEQPVGVVDPVENNVENDLGPDDIRFPRAGVGIYILLVTIVLIGFVQVIFLGDILPVVDIPATAGFIYLFFGFIKYDSTADVAVIGPRESGKSLFLLGLYLTYRNREGAGGADGHMRDLIRQADNMTHGDDFPIPNTEDLEQLSFNIVSGQIFPSRVNISVTDHSGEICPKLARNLQYPLEYRKKLDYLILKLEKAFRNSELSAKERFFMFEYQVRKSDIVILLIDIERLENPNERNHISNLQTVGERVNLNGGEVLTVATKCDLVTSEFSNVIDSPIDEGFNQAFGQKINKRLRNENISIDELVEEVGAGWIYPVYYKTTEKDHANGDKNKTKLVPKLDDNGNLQPRGFEPIADRLEREL